MAAQNINLLVLIHSSENPYARATSGAYNLLVTRAQLHVRPFSTIGEVRLFCKINKITHIATTQFNQFKLFDKTLEGTAASNQGAMLVDSASGLRICLLPSLKTLHTANEGRFLLGRWVRKLIGDTDEFPFSAPALDWDIAGAHNHKEFMQAANASLITSIDIETLKEGLIIRSVAYSFLLPSGHAKTYVLNIEKAKDNAELMFLISLMRNANLSAAPKVFQNGRYDNSYFLRFNAPIRNYLFDTYHLFHCLYPELDKNLSFISSFCLSNFRYWKDESVTNNLEYNAKDTHYTLYSFLALVYMANRKGFGYALTNYIDHEFRLVFPCIQCGQEGLIVDIEEKQRLRVIEVGKKESALKSLQVLLGEPNFNPGSPKQVVSMQKAVGYAKAEGSDKTAMQEFAEAHPLYENLNKRIIAYRKAAKAISTYYDAELLNGNMHYEIDPAGTETFRLASKQSNYWCGSQIQNQPGYCKSMYVPPAGWLFGCADGAQAESRCTAYISEDKNLINSVETSPDFHCTNASLFFGIPFNELYQIDHYDQDGNHFEAKVLRKDIRTVAKRVNHGANYNMGWFVLLQTMGAKEVWKAKSLLGLPNYYGLREVCIELLLSFNKAYPRVKNEYYQNVKDEVARTGRMVGATGLTRRTFLKPDKSKRALNAAVAHPPQSLSVTMVNKAFFKTWHWQLFESGKGKIRLKAQIHDEIFFIHRKGYGPEVAAQVGAFMAEPVTVNGRTMVIPNEPKWDAARWSDLKE